MAFGCQLPVRSGWPSAVRGVGPVGASGAPPRPRPPPPRHCPAGACATRVELSRIVAAAATTATVILVTINFIRSPLSSQKVYPYRLGGRDIPVWNRTIWRIGDLVIS